MWLTIVCITSPRREPCSTRDYFPTLFADQDDSGVEIGTIVNIVVAFVIGGIAVWDIVDGFLEARRVRRAVRAA